MCGSGTLQSSSLRGLAGRWHGVVYKSWEVMIWSAFDCESSHAPCHSDGVGMCLQNGLQPAQLQCVDVREHKRCKTDLVLKANEVNTDMLAGRPAHVPLLLETICNLSGLCQIIWLFNYSVVTEESSLWSYNNSSTHSASLQYFEHLIIATWYKGRDIWFEWKYVEKMNSNSNLLHGKTI